MPGAFHTRDLQDVDIGQQDQHQGGEKHQRIYQPRASEKQSQLDDGLGLQKHERRAKEEHRWIDSRPASGRRWGHEEENHRHAQDPQDDHRANAEVRDQFSAEVEKRPVVAGQKWCAAPVKQRCRRNLFPLVAAFQRHGIRLHGKAVHT